MPSVSTPQHASPSPPPEAPPTLSAPGPRASTIQKLFNDALSHTLKTCSYSNFASCFPTPAKYVPEALDQLHRDFIGKLDTNAKREFANVMEERNVIASLNELDGLVADAKRRKQRAEVEPSELQVEADSVTPAKARTPPHLLPPSALLAAHLAPFLQLQQAELSSRLEETQSANKALADDTSTQRAEIERLIAGLEGVVADLEGAAGALQGEQMEGIEHELIKGAAD